MQLSKIVIIFVSASILVFLVNSQLSSVDSSALPVASQITISQPVNSAIDQPVVAQQSINSLITSDIESGVLAVDNPPVKPIHLKEIPVDTRASRITRDMQNTNDHAQHHGHEDSDKVVYSRPPSEPKREN